MSAPLDVKDAIAIVYGVLLFLSPRNSRPIVVYTYTDCSSTQVVKCTGTVLCTLAGRNLKSSEIGVSSICTTAFLSSPLILEKNGTHSLMGSSNAEASIGSTTRPSAEVRKKDKEKRFCHVQVRLAVGG